jgi:hypothetical protein
MWLKVTLREKTRIDERRQMKSSWSNEITQKKVDKATKEGWKQKKGCESEGGENKIENNNKKLRKK